MFDDLFGGGPVRPSNLDELLRTIIAHDTYNNNHETTQFGDVRQGAFPARRCIIAG